MNWKPLFKADHETLACLEGETYLFAFGGPGQWEYFVDAIIWDADEGSEPQWREGEHGWDIGSTTHFAEIAAPEAE